MRKEAVVGAVLLGLTGPVAALDQDSCLRINQAVAEAQLAMVGMGDLDAAKQELVTLSDSVPSMHDELEAMVQVANKAENIKPFDSSHPIQTGEYDKVEAAYQKKFLDECGDL